MIDEGDDDLDCDRRVEASSSLIDCESLKADDSAEEEEEGLEVSVSVGAAVGADVVCGGDPARVVLVAVFAGGGCWVVGCG